MEEYANEEGILEERERGGCLTWALVVFTLGSAIAVFVNFTSARSIARNLPGAPSWAENGVYAVGSLGLLGIIGLIGIWNWKKWGAYVYLGTGLVIFPLNLALNVGLPFSLAGLVGLVVMAGLIKPNWPYMD